MLLDSPLEVATYHDTVIYNATVGVNGAVAHHAALALDALELLGQNPYNQTAKNAVNNANDTIYDLTVSTEPALASHAVMALSAMEQFGIDPLSKPAISKALATNAATLADSSVNPRK